MFTVRRVLWTAFPILLGVGCAAPIAEDDDGISAGAISGETELPSCAKSVDLSLNGESFVNPNICPKAGQPLAITFKNERKDPYDVMLRVRASKNNVKDIALLGASTFEILDSQGLQFDSWNVVELGDNVFFTFVVRHAEKAKGEIRAKFMLPTGVNVANATAIGVVLGAKFEQCSARDNAKPVCYSGKCNEDKNICQ